MPAKDGTVEKAIEVSTVSKPSVSRRDARWIYGFMLLMQFMLALDTTSVAVALPTIAKEMKANKTLVFSLGTVFTLSASVFQQPIAEISHVMGRKPAFLFVLAVFFLGSVVAATANNMGLLLAGRALQGFASGGSVLTAIVLTDLIELKDRATWLVYQNAVQAAGLVLGPLIGAALLEISWRWLFWVNLPLIPISAAGLWFLLGFDMPKEGIWSSLPNVDWLGMAIFTLSAASVLIPVTMAGVILKWDSPVVIMSLVAGFLGFGVLAVQQRRASNPMFKTRLFEEPVTVCAFFGQTVFGICVNMIFYYLVVYWSGVRGFDAIITGVLLLPEMIMIPLAAVLCGLAMRRWGQIRAAMIVGWPLTAISIVFLWFLDTKTPLGALIVINALVGVGAGIVISALNVTVLASTRREDNGHAMAMGILFKTAGMCLGVAIGTAVFTAQMETCLKTAGGGEVEPESFMIMLHSMKADPAAQEVIIQTLRTLWWICSGLAALATVLCCSCKYPGFKDHAKPAAQATELEKIRSNNCTNSGTSSKRSSQCC